MELMLLRGMDKGVGQMGGGAWCSAPVLSNTGGVVISSKNLCKNLVPMAIDGSFMSQEGTICCCMGSCTTAHLR